MKDILIVASTRSNPHLDACKTMTTASKALGAQVIQPLENTWLLSGPRSFEIATRLLEIAHERSLPVAVFEIESILLDSSLSQKDNQV